MVGLNHSGTPVMVNGVDARVHREELIEELREVSGDSREWQEFYGNIRWFRQWDGVVCLYGAIDACERGRGAGRAITKPGRGMDFETTFKVANDPVAPARQRI